MCFESVSGSCEVYGTNDQLRVQAVTLFSQLRQEGLQPNAITFTTLMKAYQRSGQLQKATATFQVAQQEGQANIVATNAFIDVLVGSGKLDMASQVLPHPAPGLLCPPILTVQLVHARGLQIRMFTRKRAESCVLV